MDIVLKKALAYVDDKSNKVYFAVIVKEAGGFLVNFEFGKRDTKMQVGTKTPSSVNEETARKLFDKIISEKLAKGYYEE